MEKIHYKISYEDYEFIINMHDDNSFDVKAKSMTNFKTFGNADARFQQLKPDTLIAAFEKKKNLHLTIQDNGTCLELNLSVSYEFVPEISEKLVLNIENFPLPKESMKFQALKNQQC